MDDDDDDYGIFAMLRYSRTVAATACRLRPPPRAAHFCPQRSATSRRPTPPPHGACSESRAPPTLALVARAGERPRRREDDVAADDGSQDCEIRQSRRVARHRIGSERVSLRRTRARGRLARSRGTRRTPHGACIRAALLGASTALRDATLRPESRRAAPW